MKFSITILFFFLLVNLSVYGQLSSIKPPIDSSAYEKWTAVEYPSISDDGRYVSYIIKNQPIGSQTLVSQTSDGKWKNVVPGGENVKYSPNGRFITYKKGDTLVVLNPQQGFNRYIAGVSVFTLFGDQSHQCLVYKKTGSNRNVIVQSFLGRDETSFSNVVKFIQLDENNLLIMQDLLNARKTQRISIYNALKKNTAIIYEGSDIDGITVDGQNNGFAFMVTVSNLGVSEKEIWYYKKGLNKVFPAVTKDDLLNRLTIASIMEMDIRNDRIFFKASFKQNIPQKNKTPQLTIWSYISPRLPTEQIQTLNQSSQFLAVVNLSVRKVSLLEKKNEQLILPTGKNFQWGLIEKTVGDAGLGESTWNKYGKRTWAIINLKTGIKRELPNIKSPNIQISPLGNYLIYYDFDRHGYFCYTIESGVIKNITESIKTNWLSIYNDDYPDDQFNVRGIAGWTERETSVLIYDKYDIWKIDPLQIKNPVNLTNDFGLKNHIIFDLPEKLYDGQIKNNQDIILQAFNIDSKDNGFFSINIGHQSNPEKLIMGPWVFCILNNPYIPSNANFSPLKSKSGNHYIVRRMSATDAPNYFYTTDFKYFNRISDLHPQTDFNWYTTELHTWNKDNIIYQGILYKPKDFDSQKKYPVIFYYYERMSDGLNIYLQPEFSHGELNVPWYVSHGYLVFCPDIHFKIGSPGNSALISIKSAAEYLKKNFYFVNANKLGLQGISLGGFETNYIVTHSNLFSAACSSSGASDLISKYGSLRGETRSGSNYYETGQGRMGSTLWDSPEKYVKNSPVIDCDKVATPILLMHTKNDSAVPFTQAIEFFTGLRRLGKKAWLLEYRDGNHTLSGESALDFSVRMSQFFDHYLKDQPAPEWMTRPIPTIGGAVNTGTQLDQQIKTPGPSLLDTTLEMDK